MDDEGLFASKTRIRKERMAKRAAFLVMWISVALVAVETKGWWCRAHDAAESAKENAEDIKEDTESWTGWAINKFSEARGSKGDDVAGSTQRVADKVGEAASKSTETMNAVASDSAEYASDKVSNAANAATEHAGDAKEYLSDVASDAEDTVQDAFSQGWDKAGDIFGLCVQKLDVVYPTVGDTISPQTNV